MPAIDLRNGKCVRLVHGKTDQETVYGDDPVAMAEKWVAAGAKRLHVVDLDGAFSGEPKNLDWVVRIKKKTKVTVQMGGGLRNLQAISGVLKAGIDKVILGSIVLEEAGLAKSAFEQFRSQIMVALDVKGDEVAIHGWKDGSGVPLSEALSIAEKLGAQECIFTDISRDGTLGGANLQRVVDVMARTKMKVYASGGVSSIEDIERLKLMNSPGCVVGKAIYEGKLDLAAAIRIAQG